MTSKPLGPLTRATAADGATTALFNAIVEGTLPPGSQLRLQELADQFGLSMMPVREAVRRLEHLGLVELEPHRGAFVRPKSLDDLKSIYEIRFILEGEAAHAAAKHFTSDAEETARAALGDLTRHLAVGDTQHARDAHERFHFVIYEAAGNPWLVRSIMPLWRNAERYRLESMRHSELASQRAQEHKTILDVVIAGDGMLARDTMVRHLRCSMEFSIDALTAATSRSTEPATNSPA